MNPVMPSASPVVDRSGADFFEQKYRAAADHDPWSFASNEYELDRYRRVLDALPNRHYGAAFEPGCSVGALSSLLSRRCDHLLAMDFAPTAIEEAIRRAAHRTPTDGEQATIEFRVGALPEDLGVGDGPFDLIVFAEIGYYFALDELDLVAAQLVDHLHRGGDLVAAHWTGHSADHRLSGEATHDRLVDVLSDLGCLLIGERERHRSTHHGDGADDRRPDDHGFIIDRWRRS